MLRLIEKIIDYIFGDYIHLFTVCSFILVFGILAGLIVDCSYRSKLETDVKIAKIAAGQKVECEKPTSQR